jgi:hypothetical protein
MLFEYILFFFENLESSFFEKLMTYSGLVSGYIWSKKAKKKDNLIFFKQKIFFKWLAFYFLNIFWSFFLF